MRVLLVITGLGMGGAEHAVVNLADELYTRGYSVKIVYLTGEALVKPNNLEIELIPLNLNKASDLFHTYWKLSKVINSFRPHVVHSHMYHANILCRLLRLKVNIPKLISTSHSNFEGGKARMLTYRATDRLATISTNVSKNAALSMIENGAYTNNRVLSIPNGIDTEKFKYNEACRLRVRKSLGITDKQMILAIGRMNPAKDYPNLFQAIALLKQYRSDFILFIAGDGPLKSDLIQLAEDLSITRFIVMLGIRYDVPDLMSACDIFVLPSAWEGFGLVVAEAMASERVVVATDCGGVSEIVSNYGFLVKPSDSKLLSEKLNEVLDIGETEKSMIGTSAREHIIENFSLNKNVDSYISLYKE